MNGMSIGRAVWLVSVLLLLAAGCARQTGELRIVSNNMRFSPETLRLRAGEPVTLTLVNRDGYGHSFDIDELDVHVPLPAGATATVSFTPTAAGALTFYCAVGGHTRAGMVGTLTVDDGTTATR